MGGAHPPLVVHTYDAAQTVLPAQLWLVVSTIGAPHIIDALSQRTPANVSHGSNALGSELHAPPTCSGLPQVPFWHESHGAQGAPPQLLPSSTYGVHAPGELLPAQTIPEAHSVA
jgi:hypothetical protein